MQKAHIKKPQKHDINMKSRILIGIIMILMMVIPIVSAVESLGTFKTYQCIDLLQTCSNCTYVNISNVMSPTSQVLLGESVMTNTGTYYNYTFCNTTTQGTYRVNGHGDLGGVNEVWSYTFNVNPTGGPENNTTVFFVLAGSAVVLLILAFVMHNYIFSIISGFLFLGSGVYGMINGFGAIINSYTQIISYVMLGIGFIITIVSILDYLSEMSGGDESKQDEEYDDE
jgi:hypothetical protein